MKNIEILFQQRSQEFDKRTEKILKHMSPIIEGVVHYLSLTEELSQGDLTWQTVVLQDDIVMLVGIIQYPPGAQFTTSGGEIMTVSEHTKEYFTRILRMGLPIDLVNRGSKKDTINFLSNLNNEQISKHDMIPPELIEVNGFDLDKLTNEQRQEIGRAHV